MHADLSLFPLYFYFIKIIFNDRYRIFFLNILNKNNQKFNNWIKLMFNVEPLG